MLDLSLLDMWEGCLTAMDEIEFGEALRQIDAALDVIDLWERLDDPVTVLPLWPCFVAAWRASFLELKLEVSASAAREHFNQDEFDAALDLCRVAIEDDEDGVQGQFERALQQYALFALQMSTGSIDLYGDMKECPHRPVRVVHVPTVIVLRTSGQVHVAGLLSVKAQALSEHAGRPFGVPTPAALEVTDADDRATAALARLVNMERQAIRLSPGQAEDTDSGALQRWLADRTVGLSAFGDSGVRVVQLFLTVFVTPESSRLQFKCDEAFQTTLNGLYIWGDMVNTANPLFVDRVAESILLLTSELVHDAPVPNAKVRVVAALIGLLRQVDRNRDDRSDLFRTARQALFELQAQHMGKPPADALRTLHEFALPTQEDRQRIADLADSVPRMEQVHKTLGQRALLFVDELRFVLVLPRVAHSTGTRCPVRIRQVGLASTAI